MVDAPISPTLDYYNKRLIYTIEKNEETETEEKSKELLIMHSLNTMNIIHVFFLSFLYTSKGMYGQIKYAHSRSVDSFSMAPI